MNELRNMEYNDSFYINTRNTDVDRIWNTNFSSSRDVILKTKLGSILKSNSEKSTNEKGLKEFIQEGKSIEYKKTLKHPTNLFFDNSIGGNKY